MKRILALALALFGLVFVLIGSGPSTGSSPRLGTKAGLSNNLASLQGGSSTASWDTVLILFTMDPTPADHDAPEHDIALDAADLVVDLTGVTSFAYGYPSLGDADGSYNDFRGRWHVPTRISGQSPVSLDIRINQPAGINEATDRAMPIFHIPFEDYIPDNSTIVSAVLYPWFYDTKYFARGDTAMAVLMTNPNDDEWYTSKGITVNYPNYSHASWDHQISSNSSDPNWAVSDTDVWSPLFSDRTYFWDMGDYWDWSGSNIVNNSSNVAIPVRITNCVQAVVNGAVNNGIALLGGDSNITNQSWNTYIWDERSSNIDKSPFVIVKYITKKYQLPFGTSDWAFVVSTDDGKRIANTAYVGVAADHGGHITIAVNDTFTRLGGLAAEIDTLISWHDDYGMEIVSHSLTHPNPLGLLTYQPADSSAIGYDRIRIQSSPEWLYTMADSIDGDERRSSPYWAKSIAMPNNSWGPEVLRILADMEYVQVRVGAVAGPVIHGDYPAGFFDVDQGTANSRVDSLWIGASHPDQRKPRNMMGHPITMTVVPIVGSKSNTTITEAQVKHNMKRAISHIKGDGRGVLSLFWHDFKSGGYAEGVDEEEFDWMADVVNEMGGRWMRLSEYGRWIKRYATPIDRPVALDTFSYLAADNVWFIADGIDQTWIRGVR